ncbi:ATP-binding protein [Acrocarpospora macrocephala]|uniref:ATP-binding protein n=1 Tax=Acrocarpospora macrocephala TaxID=150177 RepID=UPI0014787A09|nr:ATP-binding protein [Acrocarpospora macrocephala]
MAVERGKAASKVAGILLSLEFEHGAITQIRHLVQRSAATAGLTGAALDDYVLAVHEAVTNAVKYGNRPRSISIWEESGAFFSEVRDSGPGIPYQTLTSNDLAERSPFGGRGLWLMRHLTRTTIQTGPDGTTIRLAASLP